MVVSMCSIDSVINAYNKQQRVKVRNVASSEGKAAGEVKPSDEVTLSKQGLEAAEVYNKITDKLIDNLPRDEKK